MSTITYTNLDGVDIVNVTPHPITFRCQDGTDSVVESSGVLNAKCVEEQVDELFVKTVFVGTQEGDALLDEIEDNHVGGNPMVVVGSLIAAQAYPGRCVALTPAKGFERVPPAEKRMNTRKFTTFA